MNWIFLFFTLWQKIFGKSFGSINHLETRSDHRKIVHKGWQQQKTNSNQKRVLHSLQSQWSMKLSYLQTFFKQSERKKSAIRNIGDIFQVGKFFSLKNEQQRNT